MEFAVGDTVKPERGPHPAETDHVSRMIRNRLLPRQLAKSRRNRRLDPRMPSPNLRIPRPRGCQRNKAPKV
jgi:hypothetical protein